MATNKEKLLQSGVLVIRYAQKKPQLSDTDHQVIKQFIANGGRILLLCPAWVWTGYEKKPLELLPHHMIAKNFDVLLTSSYVGRPLTMVHPDFLVEHFDQITIGTFSEIIYQDAQPILVGRNDKAAAVAVEREDARLVVYSHNSLLTDKVSAKPEGLQFTRKVFDWLLNP